MTMYRSLTSLLAGVALVGTSANLRAQGSAAGPLKWEPSQPDVIGCKPTAAKWVRLTLASAGSGAGAETCLDEIEILTPNGKDNLALASRGAKATAQSCLTGHAIHQVAHLNDGLYGNDHSWIAATPDSQWVMIELPQATTIDRVIVSRDRTGKLRDRCAGQVRVETSVDGKAFTTVAEAKSAVAVAAPVPAAPPPPSLTSGQVVAPPAEPAGDPSKAPVAPSLMTLAYGTWQADFEPVQARYVRVVTGNGPVEEIALYAPPSRDNLALAAKGARAGASSHFQDPKKPASPYHVSYLNDGRYGAGSAWAPDRGDKAPWIEVALPAPAKVSRVLLTGPGAMGGSDVYVSADQTTWTKVGRAVLAASVCPSTVPEADKGAWLTLAAELARNKSNGTDILAQYGAMIERFAARSVDVKVERTQLVALRTRLESFLPESAWPADAVALLVSLRQAKRELFLRDPELAPASRILFVKRHPYVPSHNYSDFMDGRLQGGGGVCVLEIPRTGGRLAPESAAVKTLFGTSTGIARDVTLDWDAQNIWFAYMPDARAGGYREPAKNKEGQMCAALPESRRWHLYRLPVDGGEAKQITSGPHHDYYPCVLPNNEIAFVTTRCNMRFLCWVPTTMTLYRMKQDGSDIRAISHNNLSEWGPTVRRDGRIMWTRSEYQDKGADYGHTIWAIRPDGTFSELVYGNNTDHNIMNAMEVPGRENELLATKISHFGDFNGPLCYINLSKGPYDPSAMQAIPGCQSDTSNGGIYRDPYPIATDLLLCSYKAGNQFALYAMDRWGNRELLYEDTAIGCMSPVPVAPRQRPPQLPEVSGKGPATMTVMDVYDGLGPTVARGSVKWLRIVRELPSFLEVRGGEQRKETYDDFLKYYASPIDVVVGPSGWPAYCAKEVVGVVPVEEDGSAHFTVPAEQMFYFQALDKDYNEIQRMRSVMQAKAGETRTCLGCHDDRLRTGMPAKHVLAMAKPAATPTPPPWGAGPFWYEKVVQPVIDRRCVSCHGGPTGSAKPDLTATLEPRSQAPASYRALVNYVHYFNVQWAGRHRIAAPLSFGTLKSRLFATLKDKNHETVQLSSNEMQALKCWVDLNCPLWGDYQHRDERAGGRKLATAEPIGFKVAKEPQ